MYEKCIRCEKIGAACRGPEFMEMTSQELMAWCKERKSFIGWSNARLAEEANMAKGTVDGLLAGKHPDFKFESVRPLVKALVGGAWNDNPCPETPSDPALVLQVHDLEKDLSFAEKTIKHLEDSLRSWKQAIYAMMLLCGILAVSLVGYINMDMNNTNIGLFRENYISPAVLLPTLGILAAFVAVSMLIRWKVKSRNKTIK